MRRAHGFGRACLVALAVAAVPALISFGKATGSSRDNPAPGGVPAAPPTVEPLPGLALELRIDSVQETARGGIIALTLSTASDVPIETLRLAMRLPRHVIFADGSQERSWELSLEAGGARALPLDLLIDRPGRFHLSAEATGTIEGRAIRRGVSSSLDIGRGERRREVRNGAIQHRGVIRGRGGDR